jgi:hypothetical protein
MVVHYIYDNDVVQKTAKYFDLKYNKNLAVDDAIQQAFGISAATVTARLRAFWERRLAVSIRIMPMPSNA